MDFPIIDISGLSDPAQELRIAREIAFVSRQHGYAILLGHGISNQDLDNMYNTTRTFFDLPADSKLPWDREEGLVRYESAKKYGVEAVLLSCEAGTLRHSLDVLPPFMGSRLDQLEAFKLHCQRIVRQIARCFDLAMGIPGDGTFAPLHTGTPPQGPMHDFRMYSYPSDTPAGSQAMWQAPTTHAGSIMLSFKRGHTLDIEYARDQWAPVPDVPYGIGVELGDAVTAWSKRQSVTYQFRDTIMPQGSNYGMVYTSIAGPHSAARRPDEKTPPVSRGPKWVSASGSGQGPCETRCPHH